MSKKPATQDWHRADIKASLAKAGWTMSALSRAHDYKSGCLRVALIVPWPKVEAIIASALNVTPQTIWPSRYHADGTPRSGRNERGRGRYKPSGVTNKANKHYSDCTGTCNVNVEGDK